MVMLTLLVMLLYLTVKTNIINCLAMKKLKPVKVVSKLGVTAPAPQKKQKKGSKELASTTVEEFATKRRRSLSVRLPTTYK